MFHSMSRLADWQNPGARSPCESDSRRPRNPQRSMMKNSSSSRAPKNELGQKSDCRNDCHIQGCRKMSRFPRKSRTSETKKSRAESTPSRKKILEFLPKATLELRTCIHCQNRALREDTCATTRCRRHVDKLQLRHSTETELSGPSPAPVVAHNGVSNTIQVLRCGISVAKLEFESLPMN